MACPKCGCRLLTKGKQGQTTLICCDCGHPLGPSHGQQPFQWHQLSTVLLLFLIAATALGLSLLSESLMREDLPQERPIRVERFN